MKSAAISRWVYLLGLLCLGSLGLRAGVVLADTQQVLADASGLEAHGEHAAAAQKYTGIITDQSIPAVTRRLAYIGRGVAFGNQANFTAAINDFTQAITLDPSLSDGYYDRALMYSDTGQYAQALADFNFIASAAASYPAYFYYRGYMHFENDEFHEAVADFDKALTTMPKSAEVHYRRAKAFASLNMRERALQDFEATTHLTPPAEILAAAYRWHGTESIALRRYEPAEKDFSAILRDSPMDADARMRRAWAYSLQKKYALAVQDYDQVIHQDVHTPMFPWPGIVDADQILPDRIIDQYNAGMLAPGLDPYAYVLRARAHRGLGDDQRAAADYRAAIAAIPAGSDDSVAAEMAGLTARRTK